MPFALTSLADLAAAPFDDIIDVRAPAEYAEDRIPGAISLPVLSDAERAEVGTIYTQVDRFQARKIGAALVARNAADHLRGPLADKPGSWRPLVYCWRGGQRSGSFASILTQIGWRVATLEGGYRSFRRLVAAAVHDVPVPHRFVLIDGDTGTAKTALLERLAARGHQVIDLEALSGHRGSVFGAQPGGQPAQKAFESALALALATMDPARPVLLEAEGHRIGNRQIPESVWAAMKAAPRLEIVAPREERARYLVRAYGDLTQDPGRLEMTVASLKPIQGAERIALWREHIAAGEYERLAEALIAHHYDPRYAKARRRHATAPAATIRLDRLDAEGLDTGAAQIEAAVAGLTWPE